MDYMNLINECETECSKEFKKIDALSFNKTKKVLDAFHEEGVCESDF